MFSPYDDGGGGDDDDVYIVDDTKISFLMFFNFPLDFFWKATTIASLSDDRHLV